MHEQSLFAELLDLTDAAARQARLDQLAGQDPVLRQRMERLLARHAAAGSFLEHPPEGTAAFVSETFETPGTVVGHYRLLELIGEGGMGAVYMAEQTEPVRRRVAVKIIKPGMDSLAVVARFEAERQALALMDHPNIARVFDGGTTIGEPGGVGPGRPYFVMELVRGLPITEYCDRAKLPIFERLALFTQVCRAVQHAHTKGIIHRDLKPSNVLVTVIDGKPVPKVIDFGIAKATGSALTDRTLFTGFHQLVGTPLYMAPEQAEMSGVDVDTRADVYSLGVLLYQLLTGTTPFDPEVLKTAGFDEMRRMIREVEPARPSQRISTLAAEQSSTVADSRGVDPRRLGRLMQSELDWVVMKALDKDRNRRYETAAEFAADIERYMANEPVEARPPTAAYRIRKFVRRNRTELAMAGILSAAFLITATALGWSALHTATRQAEAEGIATEALAEADHWEKLGHWADAKTCLDRAAAALGSQKNAEVEGRLRIANFVKKLEENMIAAMSTAANGLRFDLEPTIQVASDAFREFGLDVENMSPNEIADRLPKGLARSEFVGVLDAWALSLRKCRRDSDGWRHLIAAAQAADPDPWRDRLRSAWERTPKVEPDAIRELVESAPLSDLHPSTIALLDDTLESIANESAAIDFLCESVRCRPADFRINSLLGIRLQNTRPPRVEEALGYFRAALALRPNSPGAHVNVGTALDLLGRHKESVAVNEKALTLQPSNVLALNNLAVSYGRMGDLARAEEYLRLAIRDSASHYLAYFNLGTVRSQRGNHEEAARMFSESIRLKPTFALARTYYGISLGKLGRAAEALPAFQEGVRLDPDNWETQASIGVYYCDVSQEYDKAIPALQAAVRLGPSRASLHYNLGVALHNSRKLPDAEVAFREALRLDPNHAGALDRLGAVLMSLGKKNDAIATLREAILISPDDPRRHFNLGNAHLASKQFSFAQEAFLEAIRLKSDYAEAHCNLGHALRLDGQLVEALTAMRRGHELGSKNPQWKYPSAQWIKDCEALLEEAAKRKPSISSPQRKSPPG